MCIYIYIYTHVKQCLRTNHSSYASLGACNPAAEIAPHPLIGCYESLSSLVSFLSCFLRQRYARCQFPCYDNDCSCLDRLKQDFWGILHLGISPPITQGGAMGQIPNHGSQHVRRQHSCMKQTGTATTGMASITSTRETNTCESSTWETNV